MAKTTFESAMKRLEEIVRDLESGDLTLENAFKRFEEGMKLVKVCGDKLDETERKVTVLLEDHDGNPIEKPFQDADS